MINARVLQRFPGFELDVEIRSSGPVLGIFGRSGSGKTTLLHVLAGLLRPAGVSIEVEGERLDGKPPERRGLALVPQDPLLFPHLSVRGNLTFAPGADQRIEAEQGARILDVLRLTPLLDRRPASLSGGERQRVSLGRALLSGPRLLLLDEPVSALDAELAREVLALLLEAKRQLQVPMLFVTHRVSELVALADECLVLESGSVVAQGAPLEVLARPRAIGVARLAGVDNLLRLAVLGHEEQAGVTWLDLGGGQRLAAPLADLTPGAGIDVGVYAEDIILCHTAPGATSARNVLPATIEATDPVGHEVLVTARVGEATLRIRVTPGAAHELGLEPGSSVVALIKTTACHHLRS